MALDYSHKHIGERLDNETDSRIFLLNNRSAHHPRSIKKVHRVIITKQLSANSHCCLSLEKQGLHFLQLNTVWFAKYS